MIAASEPQEFIPSGRQQVLRHPGLPKTRHDNVCLENLGLDALVLHRLKQVSIAEENISEWWKVREVSDFYDENDESVESNTDENTVQDEKKSAEDKLAASEGDSPSSWSWKTIDPLSLRRTSNRLSDMNASKMLINKSRYSSDNEPCKNESKTTTTSKSFVSNNKSSNNKCDNLVYGKPMCAVEEELYVKGCTAVWSKGLVSNPDNASGKSRITICSYTMENPIKHALWCTFYLEKPSFGSITGEIENKPDEPLGKALQCICLVDSCNMRVFTAKSEDFIMSLQFQIASVWNTKFGILIEKQVSTFQKNLKNSNVNNQNEMHEANLYSLGHPLDEMNPVSVKHIIMQLFNNTSCKIIYTCCEPSICFIYDATTSFHCVYMLRRITSNEWGEMSISKIKVNSQVQSPMSLSNKLKHNLSVWSGQGAGLPLATGSPYSSRAASLSNLVSPHHSRSHSPMATISRCQSPSVSPFVSGGGWANRSSYSHHEDASGTSAFTQTEENVLSKPPTPELCLELIWTENTHTTKGNFGQINGPASKAFLSTDLVGQNYLCYLVPIRGELVLTRMDLSNDNKLIFGTSYCIKAKDACAIPKLNMIAILDLNGHIMLNSGPTVIGKVHVGGVSAEFTKSPHSQQVPSHLKSPFPRRSSLLPHCATPTGVPKFDEHMLSPVPPALLSSDNRRTNVLHSTLLNDQFMAGDSSTSTSNITALRDPVSDRLTLQYADNSYYRISLPALASGPLVTNCLNALKNALQKDVTLTLFAKWYAMRNAPGPVDLTLEQEWQLFISIMYSLLGYDVDKLKNMSNELHTSSEETKRQRPSPEGSASDWEDMLKSEQHREIGEDLANLLHLNKVPASLPNSSLSQKGQIDTNALLFPYFRIILLTLHLLYEEIKLNVIRLSELPLLAKFLHQLASDLRLQNYVIYYWKDYPDVCALRKSSPYCQISDASFTKISSLQMMSEEPVSIMKYLYDLLSGLNMTSYPHIKYINVCSRNIIQLCGVIAAGRLNKSVNIDALIKNINLPGARLDTQNENERSAKYLKWNWAEKVVVLMTEMNITRRELDNIPPAINLILHEALWECRENPPTNWSAHSYYLIQRPDLAVQAQYYSQKGNEDKCKNRNRSTNNQSQLRDILPTIKQYDPQQKDGMEDVESTLLKLRFPDDHRVTEARRLLQSSEPVHIGVVQRPEVSDHDFIEEQEKHLYAICTRTMALPVGRGMFTMRTATPVVTEPLPVPKLCLTGRAPPHGASVELSHIDTPPNMNMWPLFHNGVAAGLRISPDASDIDSTWIVFNKPKSSTETPMEHAGFLMALGLNGHLKNLAVLNMYEYLVKFSEMTSVGLLLGLAATKRGTMDTYTTKMLSIHIEALLPPTSMELDVPQNIQVAALLGIGLVYQGSAHRHIAEVLLSEIGRPPGPEMENSVDRESYSLAAGLALGLVTLKQSGIPSGFTDLGVPDMLHYYMVGGNKRPLTGSQKDKYKVPSFQIREGTTANLDVTAPGATLALGLMYLGSGNRAIADWMRPPDTQYLLDFIRPDFLMLRIIARALILWDEIKPSTNWVDSQVPEAIRPFCLVKPSTDIEMDIDYEAMNQAYCNIVAGACFALALRYAGSADENAFQTLYHYCRMFTSLTVKSIAELAGKPTIETCLNLILLSLGIVMAGTGRLEVLRLCRHLRKRVGVASSSVVTYGSHVAIHMALGLLFLGGGRYTLSNSPASVAAMMCAFFPKFPTHSNDNRYHLQPFRHLYVLAVEPRLLVPRDVLTGRMCYASLTMITLNGSTLKMRAPCLLPDLTALSQVTVQDERYWPVVFERGRNWDQLSSLLESSGYVGVKQRAGCLSYLEDPLGSRSLLAQALTQSSNIPWTPLPSAISSFSSEPTVRYFTEHFLNTDPEFVCGPVEEALRQTLTMAMYECVTKDKLAILPIWIIFIKILESFDISPRVYQVWQLKLLFIHVLNYHSNKNLISPQIALSMKECISKCFDKWEPNLRDSLVSYISGKDINLLLHDQFKLASFISFFDMPYNINVQNISYLHLFMELQHRNVSSECVNKIINLLL